MSYFLTLFSVFCVPTNINERIYLRALQKRFLRDTLKFLKSIHDMTSKGTSLDLLNQIFEQRNTDMISTALL